MRISDWSSDVCSSDLRVDHAPLSPRRGSNGVRQHAERPQRQGRVHDSMTDFRTVELSDPGIDPTGLRFMTVKSAALGARADISLFVPDCVAGLADVPIVILLHGVYGSHWAWALKGGAHLTAQRLIDEETIPPLVLAK